MRPSSSSSFDVNSNTFTLNYAKVGIGVNADPVGLRLDLGYGATGSIINAANPPGRVGTRHSLAFSQQAYATIAPVTNLTLDFGKFVTTAGAEVIEANKNWIYSRSILFFNIPLLHTGVRATYKVSDVLTAAGERRQRLERDRHHADITGDKTYGVSANITVPGGGRTSSPPATSARARRTATPAAPSPAPTPASSATSSSRRPSGPWA